MQCPGALQRPLRDIIKSIGEVPSCQRALYRDTLRHSSSSSHHDYSPRTPALSSPSSLSTYGTHSSRTQRRESWCYRRQREPLRFDVGHRSYFEAVHSKISRRSYADSANTRALLEENYELVDVAEGDESIVHTNTDVENQPAQDQSAAAKYKTHPQNAECQADSSPSQTSISSAYIKPFTPAYYQDYAKNAMLKEKRKNSEWDYQKSRHGYRGSDDWRKILRSLDQNTLADPAIYKKAVENVQLPQGVAGVFRDSDAFDAALEVYQQTGCRMKVTKTVDDPQHHSAGRVPFTALSLLGSKMEISAAMQWLTNNVEIQSRYQQRTSSSLNDYLFERTVSDSGEADDANTAQRGSYLEPDILSETEVEKLEFELENLLGTGVKLSVPVRAAMNEDAERLKTNLRYLRKEPMPTTTLAMTRYIKRLTQRIPRLLGRKTYGVVKTYGNQPPTGSYTGHVQTVNAHLLSIAAKPGLVPLLTSEAVTKAVQFFTRHESLPTFRVFYKSLENNGYAFTTSNYNALLALAAKCGDVHNFDYILGLMFKRGHRASPETWANFHRLMCVRFPLESTAVLETMRNKGILHDEATVQHVITNTVGNDIRAHLALRGSLAAFCRHCDHRFGTALGSEDLIWLTPYVALRMIHALLSDGRVRNAVDVLGEMWSRNEHASLNVGILNVFLTSSLRAQDPSSLIVWLKRFSVGRRGGIVPDDVTYQILMAVAWRGRFFNMTRVIWRYACASGNVGHLMKFRMRCSLIAFKPEPGSITQDEQKREHIWRRWSGKFAVGVTDGLRYTDGSAGADSKNDEMEVGLPTGSGQDHAKGLGDYADHFDQILNEGFEGDTSAGVDFASQSPEQVNETEEFHMLLGENGPFPDNPTNKSSDDTWIEELLAKPVLPLSEDARSLVDFASTPQLGKGSPERTARLKKLAQLLEQDLEEAGQCRPVLPLPQLLDRALQMDQAWHEREPSRLPHSSDTGAAEREFEEMMLTGIVVPMRRGRVAPSTTAFESSSSDDFDDGWSGPVGL